MKNIEYKAEKVGRWTRHYIYINGKKDGAYYTEKQFKNLNK